MIFKSVSVFGLMASIASAVDDSSSLRRGLQEECKIVETVENFDLEVYASKKWYVQQQAVVQYNPVEQNYCSNARYEIRESKSFWGYTVDVINSAEDKAGNEFGGPLCAFQDSDNPSKLNVAPCGIPKFLAGPYWIVAYDEAEGYALVSGGQPTIPAENGGCRSGTGINNSGLWIFGRDPERNETLISSVRQIAEDQGFDLSVLNDVDQEGCYEEEDVLDGEDAPPNPECDEDITLTFGTVFSGQQDCAWVANWPSIRCLKHTDRCPETCGRNGC